MEINMIVAAGRDGAIGKNGDLIWHISSDLKRFKTLTMGNTLIMGRKTWDSLPKKPLPGRRNIVITRNPDFKAEGAEVVGSPEEAIEIAGNDKVFVMGGAEIYNALMPFVTRIYLTEIEADCADANARLMLPPDPSEWIATDSTDEEQTPDGIKYRYVTYGRKLESLD